MVEFKAKADKIIKEKYGLEVEHICATREGQKLSYEKQFYTYRTKGKFNTKYGFPMQTRPWCNSKLKVDTKKTYISRQVLPKVQNKTKNLWISDDKGSMVYGRTQDNTAKFSSHNGKRVVSILGIAADEPKRIERHRKKKDIILPLVDIGWDEAYCRKWCEENDLLSPIYTNSARGGCWFCHNQSINQLRLLRKNYPEYWESLLKWDNDSPVSFRPDGHTVHDFDKRFRAEDEGLIDTNKRFYWKYLEDINFDD